MLDRASKLQNCGPNQLWKNLLLSAQRKHVCVPSVQSDLSGPCVFLLVTCGRWAFVPVIIKNRENLQILRIISWSYLACFWQRSYGCFFVTISFRRRRPGRHSNGYICLTGIELVQANNLNKSGSFSLATINRATKIVFHTWLTFPAHSLLALPLCHRDLRRHWFDYIRPVRTFVLSLCRDCPCVRQTPHNGQYEDRASNDRVGKLAETRQLSRYALWIVSGKLNFFGLATTYSLNQRPFCTLVAKS